VKKAHEKKPLTVFQAAFLLIGRWEQERDFERKMWLEGEINDLGEALNRDTIQRASQVGPEMTGRQPDKAKQAEARELLLAGKTQTEIRKQVGCGAGMVTRVKKELEAERKLPLSKPETPVKRKVKRS